MSFRVSLIFAWWWRWQRPALSQPQSSAEQSRNPTFCLQLFPWTALSVPPAVTQSKSMSYHKNTWFHITDQTHHQPLPQRVLLTVKDFLFIFCSGRCSAFERLLEALTHQLREMEKVTLQHMNGTTLLVPEPLHFLLPEPKGLVTVVYPAGVPDSQLETQRKVRTTAWESFKQHLNHSNNIEHRDEYLFILQAEDPTHCAFMKHCPSWNHSIVFAWNMIYVLL